MNRHITIIVIILIQFFVSGCSHQLVNRLTGDYGKALKAYQIWDVENILKSLDNPIHKKSAVKKQRELEKLISYAELKNDTEAMMVYKYQMAWLCLKRLDDCQKALELSKASLDLMKANYAKGLARVRPTLSSGSIEAGITREEWYNHGKNKILSVIFWALTELNAQKRYSQFEKQADQITFEATEIGRVKDLNQIEEMVNLQTKLRTRIVDAIMNKEMAKADKYEQELTDSHRNSGMETGGLADDYFHIATDLRIHGNDRMGLRYFFKEYNFRLNNPENIFRKKSYTNILAPARWGIAGMLGGIIGTYVDNAEAETKNDELNDFDLLRAELNIARGYMEVKEYDDSLIFYNKCLNRLGDIPADLRSIRIRGLGNIDLVDLFSDIGMVCSMSQKNEEAVQFYQRVIDLIEEARSKLSYDDFRVGYAAKQSSAYNNIIDTLVSCGRYEEALLFAEKNKSRALLDLLSSNSHQETPKISLFMGEEIKDVQSIKEHMDEDTTFIEYFLGKDKIFIWVISRSDMHFSMQKVSNSELTYLIDKHVKAITYNIAELETDSAKELYDLLIAPVRSHIRTFKVGIIPHSTLHHVPFHALKINDRYLIEDLSIFYLPSAGINKYLNKYEQGRGLEKGRAKASLFRKL